MACAVFVTPRFFVGTPGHSFSEVRTCRFLRGQLGRFSPSERRGGKRDRDAAPPYFWNLKPSPEPSLAADILTGFSGARVFAEK